VGPDASGDEALAELATLLMDPYWVRRRRLAVEALDKQQIDRAAQ
jgi:hypothetical protein